MVTFTLDGREMQVEPGTTILQAARSVDIGIPTFCYQERLSISASCRMCLVEIEGRGKLEPSCATAVAEGMVVHSHSDRVVETRGDMLEILLANHPLDCPVCDKGGECELQDTVFEYGRGDSRLRDPKRVFRNRDIELNQVIVFNANRCIQCQRCVRVCEEIVGDVALGTGERGLDSEITGTGNSLKDCSHCGNCIEVCPVGALMSIPYRYKARPWDLQRTETICGMCGTGCSLTVETRDGAFKRVKSRFDTGLNGELLCAKGRFGFDAIDGGNRIREPMVRRNGTLEPVSWDAAIRFLADKVHEVRGKGRTIRGQISPRQPNETAFLFQRLMRQCFKSSEIHSSCRFAGLRTPAAVEALAETAGRLASRSPLETVLQADCIFLLGSNAAEENPVSSYLIRAAVRGSFNRLLVASSRPGSLDSLAAATLRLRPGHESQLLAALTGQAGVADPAMAEFCAVAAPVVTQAESIALLIGTEFLRTVEAAAVLQWVSASAAHFADHGKRVQLQFLFDRPNQLGLWEMGCLPGILPGWRQEAQRPHSADGGPGLHYVLGADPAAYRSGGFAQNNDCLVVHAAHMSRTAEHADVLLPAPAFGEEEGTFTSNEGRVQEIRAIRPPRFSGPEPGQVFGLIAGALGQDLGPCKPAPLGAVIAAEIPGFGAFDAEGGAAVSGAKKTGLLPPVSTTGGKAARQHYLITGDGLFQSGQLSGRSRCLSGLTGGAYAELNPGEGWAGPEGSLVRISANGAGFTVPLKVNPGFGDGAVFIPEWYLARHAGCVGAGAEYPVTVEVELISPEG
ncbi:NADH-quinone oxidoreductase subunit NuoG [Leisingera sp. ANG-M1]|uniref:NADH-quinone oxidoreductase subunit NuoG n=1 Tax=Leisingera sp. ANG-M1 TaxID=1577895 RepID=UPI00068FABD1|nr:NADH-quinone oxidoreductase subunit NuoG [Leisingera sp. ANG-M1]